MHRHEIGTQGSKGSCIPLDGQSGERSTGAAHEAGTRRGLAREKLEGTAHMGLDVGVDILSTGRDRKENEEIKVGCH